MSFYDTIETIDKIRTYTVTGRTAPVYGIPDNDNVRIVAMEGCRIEDEISHIDEDLHLLKTEIETLKTEYAE